MGGEIWKPIRDYEGYYAVSNQGRIKGIDRIVVSKNGVKKNIKGRVLTLSEHYKNGYKSVMLTKDCKKARLLVHRLVAKAFIDNPNNLPEVNHKDENKANNRVENLEWCTHEYNNRYGTKPQKISERSSKSVKQLKHGKIINIWPSETIAAESVHGVQSGVSACCRGVVKTYKGYEWVFAE